MPRATAPKATKAIPSAATKPTKKPKHDPLPTPALSDTSFETTTPSLVVPKDLLLQIVLYKLEGSKNCDWFELSKVVNSKVGAGSKVDLGFWKKGKKNKEEGWTGSDLSELYQSTILPGLKAGKVIWHDDPTPTSDSARANSSDSSNETKVATPAPTKKRELDSATPDDDVKLPRSRNRATAAAKAGAEKATPPPAKKRRTTSASSTNTKASTTSTNTKASVTSTKSKNSSSSTRAKSQAKAASKPKGAPPTPDTGGRAVRALRKGISFSYREDLIMDDDDTEVDKDYKVTEKKSGAKIADGEDEEVGTKDQTDGNDGGEEDEEAKEDEEEIGEEDEDEGGEEEDEGAVQELEVEGLEDELDEDGVESGDQ